MYTDPNAIDFDKSYTHGPDTVIVRRSYFIGSSDVQNGETCPTSDASLVHPSNLISHGQSQDIETATFLGHNISSKQISEPSTDTETAYEPMQQTTSKQSNNPSTLQINDPTSKTNPQNEPSHSRSGKSNFRPKPNPNYQKFTDTDVCKSLFQLHSCDLLSLFFLFVHLFAHNSINFFSFPFCEHIRINK